MAANNITPVIKIRGHAYLVVLWEAMIADSTGLKYEPPAGYYLESVQGFGAFDTSGVVLMEGSNDPAASTFSALTRNTLATPNDLEFTAAAIFPSFTPSLFVRPRTTANGVGAAIDLDVYAYYRQRG